MSYLQKRQSNTVAFRGGDFRSDLEAYLARRQMHNSEKGYNFDADMHPETMEAGVFANRADSRLTAKAWGSWMCGATIHAYPERVVVKTQSAFFRQYAEQELGSLLEGVYKRPVYFQARALA